MPATDHLHCLWKLPSGDANYSTRWSEIKRLFTHNYLTEVGSNEKRNVSRIKRQEGTIWQRRFWEHTTADEADYEFHLDYIHFNPIKHGYVSRAADWPWSSFQRLVKEGIYDPDWAGSDQDLRKEPHGNEPAMGRGCGGTAPLLFLCPDREEQR